MKCVNCQGGSSLAELHFCGKKCACEWVLNLPGSEWPDVPLPASSIVLCELAAEELSVVLSAEQTDKDTVTVF